MKKYLLIAHKFIKTDRGAHTTSKRLSEHFPDYLDYRVDLESQDLENLNEKYKRIIFVTQVPSLYHFKISYSRFKNINHILMIRGNQSPSLYNSCNNGFHYYRSYPTIKYYVPFITNYSTTKDIIKNEIPRLGFYLRRLIVPDSFSCAIKLIKELKHKVKIYIMGDPAPEISGLKNVVSYNHTFNNDEFFSNITHYVYPTSRVFQDPFPNSVLEAIQTKKQIIFPEIKREHVDGIDDIKECIKWHEKFDPDIYYDNKDCPLNVESFNKFYMNLFENNFEYLFDRDKFKSFSKWIEKEVL